MKKLAPFVLSLLGLSAIAFAFNISTTSNKSSADNEVITSNDNEMIYMPAAFSSNPKDEPSYATQSTLVYDHINMGSTWDSYRGDKVKVAVIDTGINTTHEDYKRDGVSQISPKSLNTYAYTPTTDIHGGHTHGTQTSGTIFGQINGVGTAGIAPNVEFIFFKVANASGSMPYDAIRRALNKCIEYDVDVINMSIQGYKNTVTYGGTSQTGYSMADTVLKSELQSCYDAGMTIVAAAGNFNTNEPSYPASFDTVISVGALANSSSTDKAAYSNYGTKIDLVAPGSVYEPNMTSDTSYSTTQGTSFSSPIVAGAIALYKSKYPSATPAQVKNKLLSSCDSLADSSSAPGWAGNGRLNVANFLNDGPAESRVDVTGVSCTESSVTLDDNSTHQLNASILPSNATKKGLRFYSSDTSIATVDVISGLVTSKKPGSCTITVKSADDTSITKDIPITVNKVNVTGISLYATSVSLKEGAKLTAFRANVVPSNATNTNITYESSDTSVCTVSTYGTLTAVKAGTATITCTTEEGSYVGTCEVTVTKDEKLLTSSTEIEFAIDSSSMDVGTSQVDQMASYTENLTETVSIESLDPSVVSITNIDNSTDGYLMFTLNALKKGSTSIRVKGDISGVYNSYDITVNSTEPEVTLSSISVSPTKTSYFVGDAFSFKGTVTAQYSDGSSKEVTGYTVSTPDMSTSGSKTITVTYVESGVTKTATYDITVTAITLTSIEYLSNYDPDMEEHYQNVTYYPQGFILAHFNNGSSKNVYYPNFSITKAPDVTKLGVQDVTLSYTDGGVTLSVSYQVNIIEDKVTGFYVKTGPNKTVYTEGEVFNPNGMILRVYVESANDYDLLYSLTSGITFDSNPLAYGTTSVNVYFKDYFASVSITVNKGTSSTTVPPAPPTSETTVVPPSSETTSTSVAPTSQTTIVTSEVPPSSSIPSTSSSQGGGGDTPSSRDNTTAIVVGSIVGVVVLSLGVGLPIILLKKKH